MHARRWVSMPLWQLRLSAWLFQIEILSKEIRRRALEGEEWLELYARILRYFFLVILALISRKFSLISSVYTWFRQSDNILDGDVRLRLGDDLESYMARKNRVMKDLFNLNFAKAQTEREDILIAYFVREARRLPVFSELCRQARILWLLMQSDALRRKIRPIVPRSEFNEFTFDQDVCILSFCVLALDGNKERLQSIAKVLCGLFSRTDCLLDCFDDIRRGIIQIPREAFERHGLDLESMQKCLNEKDFLASPGFLEWRREEGRRLQNQWQAAMKAVRNNFGNVFSSAILTKIIQLVIYTRFYRSIHNLPV
ncbi:MAG: hypothetical protein WC831_02580 [Parcubacteria group bacterium]